MSLFLAGFLSLVVHAGDQGHGRFGLVQRAAGSWLRETQHVIVHGGLGSGSLSNLTGAWSVGADGMVAYPDSPGCSFVLRKGSPHPESRCNETVLKQPAFMRVGAYDGAQRTMLGILLANKTWPATAWILVVDDDVVVLPGRVAGWLRQFDPDMALFLTGQHGPGRSTTPCLPHNVNRTWSCCTSTKHPCIFPHLHQPPAVWKFDGTAGSMVATAPCDALSEECCASEEWPEGAPYGFPFRASPHGATRMHFAHLWPFGRTGYILSRGLLRALGPDYWERCMHHLPCFNADQRVATCILNGGFALTATEKFPSLQHHIPPPNEKCFSTYSVALREGPELRYKCVSREQAWHESETDLWALARVEPPASPKAHHRPEAGVEVPARASTSPRWDAGLTPTRGQYHKRGFTSRPPTLLDTQRN
jgi:hypothetical protein